MSFYIEPDPVIEGYKKHVDRTLLRENLKLTPQQRLEKFFALAYSRQKEQERQAQEHENN